jgi:hypothetical protein
MSKCGPIREVWASGDRIGALRIAARFFDRSVDTQIFKRGMDAHNHPDFYRQLRQTQIKSLLARFSCWLESSIYVHERAYNCL